jgi:hypothetical protein
MKKSQFKQIVKEVVQKKLAEIKNRPTYGYIMGDENSEDPTLQLIGYGNMPKSYWKRKILRDIDGLKKLIENENWEGAAYVMEKKGVLNNSINMMKEVFEDAPKDPDDLDELNKKQN